MGKRDPNREQHWRDAIERWSRSGESVRSFCRAQGLVESSFHAWRRELRRRDGEAAPARDQSTSQRKSSGTKPNRDRRFVQVHVERSPAWLEVDLGGALVLRVPASLDEASLGTVIGALRRAASC